MTFSLLAGVRDVAQLLTAVAIFIIVLLVTFFTTRFVGGYAKQRQSCKNIEVLETCRLGPGKFIQLVRIGDRYIAVAIAKDRIEMLSEVSIESLSLDKDTEGKKPSEHFQVLLEKAKKVFHRGDDK